MVWRAAGCCAPRLEILNLGILNLGAKIDAAALGVLERHALRVTVAVDDQHLLVIWVEVGDASRVRLTFESLLHQSSH